MEKIGLLLKEISGKKITDSIKESKAVIVLRYSGLSSPDLSLLRQSLRKTDASLFVVKNSTARRALKDAGLEALVKSVQGPCGIVFSKEEPVGASKALCDFAKEHDKLKFDSGFLKDRFIEKQEIESMARLPSKEVLRIQVVITLNAPIQRLVSSLNQIITKFVYCLDQIKIKKEEARQEEPKQEEAIKEEPKQEEPKQ
ncbi:MAG: 50S ribosomal protein L10 [Candidatus Omnitrophica bacterium]|nr:50S ribosomal protein L10 [Candidatus Omnitrophota bacterium]